MNCVGFSGAEPDYPAQFAAASAFRMNCVGFSGIEPDYPAQFAAASPSG